MPIPDYEQCMLPLLKYASDGKDHLFKDAVEAIANQFNLTESEKQELLPSGSAFVINNRVGWARTYLSKAGLLETPKRGVFRLSERGKELLKKNPQRVDSKLLRQFPEFNEFQKKKSDQADETVVAASVGSIGTPEEAIEAGYQGIKAALADELLTTLKNVSPAFFEKIVIDLLVKMGYGGSIKEAAKIVGKSGDGGIDGIIKEDKLGLDVIYVQAKRWDGVVGRPEIQKFAGALLGQKAKKGIFITTSSFTGDAKNYAENIEAKIVLIDGNRLSDLMIENNLGVNTIKSYEIKRIDSDYFEE